MSEIYVTNSIQIDVLSSDLKLILPPPQSWLAPETRLSGATCEPSGFKLYIIVNGG